LLCKPCSFLRGGNASDFEATFDSISDCGNGDLGGAAGTEPYQHSVLKKFCGGSSGRLLLQLGLLRRIHVNMLAVFRV